MSGAKILKYGAIVLLLLIAGFLALSYKLTHGQPYDRQIDASLVPKFKSVAIDFEHAFDSSSLPMLASCIVDIDGDGIPEVFLGGGKGQADALFRFDGGAFAEVPEAAGMSKGESDATYGAATIDVDADGDSDLFVARDSGVTLYLNSAGRFSGERLDIPFDDKSTPLSFALGDLDRDGAVDMFVSTYLPKAKMESLNSFNVEGYGSNSLLLHNNGDNTFTDITDSAGMRYTHNTFQGVFVDIDDDGELDLVVAHDTGTVKTWRNLGGLRFADTPNPTSDVFGYPMGIAVGDYNHDGRVDFFFSNTGGTAPPILSKGDLRDDQVFEDRMIFFRNDGDFRFTNVNEETQTADYEFSWGTVFHDMNLDGRQDLIIAQNFIDLPLTKVFLLPGRFLVQRPDGTFAATEEQSGIVNRKYEISPLVADFNGDGYPDLIRANLDGPARAYLNEGGSNHYLKVKLADTAASMGARVSVRLASGLVLTDWLVVGEGLVSDQSHVLTFGLGSETAVASVEVRYPDGTVEVVNTPRPDTVLEIPLATEAPQASLPDNFHAAARRSERG